MIHPCYTSCVSAEGELYGRLRAFEAERTPYVLCTVIRTTGSTPRKPGAKLVVSVDATFGTIGGGRVELEATEEARRLLAAGRIAQPLSRRLHLTHDLAMCCGGEVEIFFEPRQPQETLLVCGGGHIAQALVPMAARAHFDVFVAEDLEELTGKARFPDASGFVDGFEANDLASVPLQGAFVVVVTRDHAIDQRILETLLLHTRPSPLLAFVGLIGSLRKSMMFRARLARRGVPDEAIARLVCPIGLPIGAQTPEEIAVSILSQLIEVRASARGLVSVPHSTVATHTGDIG